MIKTLEELETELKQLRFSKMPIVPINTDLFLTLVKDANNTFKIQIKLKEDLFAFEEAGVVKLSNCLTDSVCYWHYQPGLPDITGGYNYFQNTDIAASYNGISTHPNVNVAVIPDWETLYSKADGTILNTLMVL